MKTRVDFLFRVWLPPVECDDAPAPEVEVWVHELEPAEGPKRSGREWVLEYFQGFMDLRDELLFDIELDPEKGYQVIGTGTLLGSYTWDGEYDEEMDVEDLEFTEWEWIKEATGDE